jgi:hypothetical protein
MIPGPCDDYPSVEDTSQAVVLERIRWGLTHYLDQRDIRAAVSVEHFADEFVRRVGVRVVSDMLTDKLPPQTIRRNVTITATGGGPAGWPAGGRHDRCRSPYAVASWLR